MSHLPTADRPHEATTGSQAILFQEGLRDSRMDLFGPKVRLRQWTDEDLEPLAALNADPEVMEFFPQCLSHEESNAMLGRLKRRIAERGWGVWAVEVEGELAGLTGLAEPTFRAPFTPCVEILWRFRRAFWGRGYAIEAARVSLRYAFERLKLPEVLSFTARLNVRSQRLMLRLGMTYSPAEDFEHPLIPAGHALQPHVLYRLRNTRDQIARLHRELAPA